MAIATGEQALAADIMALFEKVAMPFWGTIAQIHPDFLICDGNNGTPNLLARFIQGVATAATDPGATGGATSKNAEDRAYVNRGFTDAQSGGYDKYDTTITISDIRPLFYDVAFITYLA